MYPIFMANLTLVNSLTQKEKKVVMDGLAVYAFEKAAIKKEDAYLPFEFAYKDQEDQVVGGITGFCYYKCLYIDLLWVHPEYRNQKLGRALIEKAESFGKENECLISTVNTMDWEAPEFYQKLGYKLELIREGYMDNHKMFCFSKPLL